MIQKLEIQNYAIIESLEMQFSSGLTIITGETGAGKSILLGALGLIMGKRADTKVLYDHQKKCFVEATFDISGYDLKSYFDTKELDYFDELIIRREISIQGKSRAFVNDTPVNLNTLQELSGYLIDLHQQFDSLDMYKASFQLRTLDALADNQSLLKSYQEQYYEYTALVRQLKSLKEKNKNAAQELDFLEFQLKEFTTADLESGEQETKEIQLEKLSGTEDIKRIGNLLYHGLDADENAITAQVQEMIQELSQIKDLDRDITVLYDRLFSVKEELTDLSSEFKSVADDAEYDPELAERLRARLDLIYRLQNKHHVQSVEALLEIQNEIQSKIDSYQDLTSETKRLEKQIKDLEDDLNMRAKVLSERRQNVVKGFVAKVEHLLRPLSMENARLKVELNPAESLTSTGMDEVNFLFASNKGSAFLPLKNIASGGETSRLALCIKSLVASAIPLPTLIFDEIDTGVSGEVALKMGEILSDLSSGHQVVTITHSAQIASKAHRHYYVYKWDNEERTVTAVKLLNEEERIIEIAKMLSGASPSDAAIANARELVSN